MLTEKQVAVAGMLARGQSARSIARTLRISPTTIAQWKRDAEFMEAYERVLARGGKPDPRNTLLDALAARRDDGVDWPSRVRAAILLLGLDDPDDSGDRKPVASAW